MSNSEIRTSNNTRTLSPNAGQKPSNGNGLNAKQEAELKLSREQVGTTVPAIPETVKARIPDSRSRAEALAEPEVFLNPNQQAQAKKIQAQKDPFFQKLVERLVDEINRDPKVDGNVEVLKALGMDEDFERLSNERGALYLAAGAVRILTELAGTKNIRDLTKGSEDPILDAIDQSNIEDLYKDLTEKIHHRLTVGIEKHRLRSWTKGLYETIYKTLLNSGFIKADTKLSKNLLQENFETEKERIKAILDFFHSIKKELNYHLDSYSEDEDDTYFAHSETSINPARASLELSHFLQAILAEAGITHVNDRFNDRYDSTAVPFDSGSESEEKLREFKGQFLVDQSANRPGKLHVIKTQEHNRKVGKLFMPDHNPIKSITVILDAISDGLNATANKGRLKILERKETALAAFDRASFETSSKGKKVDINPNANYKFKKSEIAKFTENSLENLIKQIKYYDPSSRGQIKREEHKQGLETLEDLRDFTIKLYAILKPFIDNDVLVADAKSFRLTQKAFTKDGVDFSKVKAKDLLFLISSVNSFIPYDNDDFKESKISKKKLNNILNELISLFKSRKLLGDISQIKVLNQNQALQTIQEEIGKVSQGKGLNIQNLDHLSSHFASKDEHLFINTKESSGEIQALNALSEALRVFRPFSDVPSNKVSDLAKYYLDACEEK